MAANDADDKIIRAITCDAMKKIQVHQNKYFVIVSNNGSLVKFTFKDLKRIDFFARQGVFRISYEAFNASNVVKIDVSTSTTQEECTSVSEECVVRDLFRAMSMSVMKVPSFK